jgi:hypothetical protein
MRPMPSTRDLQDGELNFHLIEILTEARTPKSYQTEAARSPLLIHPQEANP